MNSAFVFTSNQTTNKRNGHKDQADQARTRYA